MVEVVAKGNGDWRTEPLQHRLSALESSLAPAGGVVEPRTGLTPEADSPNYGLLRASALLLGDPQVVEHLPRPKTRT